MVKSELTKVQDGSATGGVQSGTVLVLVVTAVAEVADMKLSIGVTVLAGMINEVAAAVEDLTVGIIVIAVEVLSVIVDEGDILIGCVGSVGVTVKSRVTDVSESDG